MIQVAVAVIFDASGRVLLAKRKPDVHLGGYWEFPGGKVESDETTEAAAIRECKEECGIEIQVVGLIEKKVFDYPDRRLELSFFECRKIDSDKASRLSGDGLKWVELARLSKYELPPANDSVITKIVAEKGASNHENA